MKMYKRLLAILLIGVLSFSLVTPVHAAESQKKILNEVTLNPITTGYAPLDQLVSDVLGKIVTSDMTTYDKVLACYNYLINNLSYSSTTWDVKAYYEIYSKSNYTSSMDKKIVYDAYRALNLKKAACNGYSSAFIVLTRTIGIPTYMVQGQTSKVGGGYTGHYWVNLKWNGAYYVFDPQVEDNIAKGGTIYYYRFCKLDSEIPGKYIYTDRDADINSFNNFSNLQSISLNATKVTLYEGDSTTLLTTLNPTSVTVSVGYKSSQKSIASVSKTGKITAKKEGNTTITVTAGNKSKKCTVTVKKTYVKLNKSKVTLKKTGDSYTIKVSFSSNLANQTVAYQSSDTNVVTVGEAGVIKATGKGTAIITASIGNYKATCKITVKK